jgi:hypothetical protein
LPTPAFAGGDIVTAISQAEDISRCLDQPVLPERLDMFLAESLDIEGLAADEMDQAPNLLRRAGKLAGATGDRFARFAENRRFQFAGACLIPVNRSAVSPLSP